MIALVKVENGNITAWLLDNDRSGLLNRLYALEPFEPAENASRTREMIEALGAVPNTIQAGKIELRPGLFLLLDTANGAAGDDSLTPAQSTRPSTPESAFLS
jgi:hypothetical protein